MVHAYLSPSQGSPSMATDRSHETPSSFALHFSGPRQGPLTASLPSRQTRRRSPSGLHAKPAATQTSPGSPRVASQATCVPSVTLHALGPRHSDISANAPLWQPRNRFPSSVHALAPSSHGSPSIAS